MKDDDYQGCGISRIWATSPEDPFKPACFAHDLAYVKGSWEQQTLRRKTIDRYLLSNMLKVSDTTLLKARAYLFYGLARSLGWIFWEGKK